MKAFPRLEAIAQRLLLAGSKVGLAVLSCALCVGPSSAQSNIARPQLRLSPVMVVPALLSRSEVEHAVTALDAVVHDIMQRTGVPGVAVAVVYKDDVVYANGFGLREVGKPDPVDTDTVFQLASVSKPIASTIIATQVGRKRFGWTDPIRALNPSFSLSDLYVTNHATLADMLSHRSGLATGAGDLLEDLGFDRDTILARLDQQPLSPFRSTYHYSNFGYTQAGEAAAKAAGLSWDDLAQNALFGPLGMSRSSYRHADYLGHANRAHLHVRFGDPVEKRWVAKYDRDPDSEAPAGGASASISDVARFLRLELNEGQFEGRPIVDPAALATTHEPQMISGSPRSPLGRGQFYGFGWNVSYDDEGRVRLGHSGAFDLGAATNVTMLPGERLGIAVLTNGEPIGAAEAIAATFFDIAEHGHQTVDWRAFTSQVFEAMHAAQRAGAASGAVPASAARARPTAAYTGIYQNSYYGPLTVSAEGDRLVMKLGPTTFPKTFALRHIDGDRFVFETAGENANGLSDATFTIAGSGPSSSLRLGFYDQTGLGTFLRP